MLQLALFLVHLFDCLLWLVVSGGGLEGELLGGRHGDESSNDTEIVSRMHGDLIGEWWRDRLGF